MNTVPLSNPVTVTQEIQNTAEFVITFLLLQEKVLWLFCLKQATGYLYGILHTHLNNGPVIIVIF